MIKKILLVDDEIDVQIWIADFLRNHGLHVDAYANGVQASQKIRENKYDLIITDLQMPKEDGISVIYKVRNVWPLNKKTPVIVITGAAGKENNALMITESLEKLDIKVLHKPFTPDTLLEEVCNAFGISIDDVDILLSAG